MPRSNFANTRPIPSGMGTRKSAPTTTNFSKGIYTYKPNDTMDLDEVYLAQNARFDRIGEYKTRRGIKKLSDPIGKTKAQDTYSGVYQMVDVEDATLTITSNDPIYSIFLTVAASNSTDYGVLELCLLDNEDNIVARSCAQNITTTPTSTEFIFNDAPTGTFTIQLATQGNATQQFQVACPSSTTPMYQLYTATPGTVTSVFEANIDGEKSILFTFKTTTGTTTLYRMAANNTVTSIRTLPAKVERVRFSQNNNIIRYTDGQEGPRALDPSNSWADTAIQTIDLTTDVDLEIKTSNILEGTQDNIIYFDAETTTQAIWTYPYGYQYAPEADYITTTTLNPYDPDQTVTTTVDISTLEATTTLHPPEDVEVDDLITDEDGNWGTVTAISGTSLTVTSVAHSADPVNSYDKFDRDFRQNFPTINTGDPLTAMFNLGGVVYFLTQRNKYYMYSQTADVWTQQAASAQHGTFSQESCVCNLNYAYYACDDGIYMFDGSSETSLTERTIQSTYDAIQGKESITLELYRNRLYVFYSSQGNGINDSCLVFNVNLRLWESFDTGTYIGATCARKSPSNRFVCGSSKFCQLYTYEDDTAEYADLNAPIDFDIETAYMHFGTPSQLHRITKWRPEFATVPNGYSVKCGYALDFTDDVKYAFSVNLKNNKPIYEHYVWDNPSDYGNPVTPTVLSTIPQVNGQFYRCQIRYQHHAAYEPINFKSHTMSCETQRLR